MPVRRQPVAISARYWPAMAVPAAPLTAPAAAAHVWRPRVRPEPPATRTAWQHSPEAVENFASRASNPAAAISNPEPNSLTMKETTMKISALAALIAVLSTFSASAAQAGGAASSGVNWHSGSNGAPACDGTGRAQKPADDGRLLGKQCPLLAGDGGPGGPTDGTSRSADVTTWHPMLAGGGVRGGDISC